MPGNTKRISRTSRTSPVSPPVISSFANEPCGQRYAPLGVAVPTIPSLEQPAAPKHFPFPNTAVECDLVFESLMCFFTLVTAGLQYLHLYRSVWWLPNSYTSQAVNFYLIDQNLVLFITVILSRRLVYMLACRLVDRVIAEKFHKLCHFYVRIFLFCVMTAILSFSTHCVLQNHQIEKILYLCYPFFIYLILFGFKIHPFFELIHWSSSTPPLHACSSNASEIRSEIENLVANFNCKMKEILFSAIINAYYAGFIPCCFAQSALHYDILWTAQHIIFIFISGFISLSMHVLSLRYFDILHRSALHLGSWEKLDNSRNMLLVNNIWRDDILWPYGSLVRYGKDIWRAQGDCNSSEPGNVCFRRFYNIFKNPTNTLGINLLVLILMILGQLVVLVGCTFWYKIISLTFILFFNYYMLYKLLRDYLICHKIYREEREMHRKINMR